MKLYLVKSEAPKIRYFFTDEEKAVALHTKLTEAGENVVLKYLKTSDEWTVEQLVAHYGVLRESL